jgi:hypothetical protein
MGTDKDRDNDCAAGRPFCHFHHQRRGGTPSPYLIASCIIVDRTRRPYS